LFKSRGSVISFDIVHIQIYTVQQHILGAMKSSKSPAFLMIFTNFHGPQNIFLAGY